MSNEQNTHFTGLSQCMNEVKNLCLNGDIKCGSGFIRNKEFWLTGKRHSDHGSLFHSPGKLMRIFIDSYFWGRNPNFSKSLYTGLFVGILWVMQAKCFQNLFADSHCWRKSYGWILKNIADRLAADLSKFSFIEGENISSFQENFSGQMQYRWNESGNRESCDAFTAAAFTYQTDNFSRVDGEGEFIYCAEYSFFGLKTKR